MPTEQERYDKFQRKEQRNPTPPLARTRHWYERAGGTPPPFFKRSKSPYIPALDLMRPREIRRHLAHAIRDARPADSPEKTVRESAKEAQRGLNGDRSYIIRRRKWPKVNRPPRRH